ESRAITASRRAIGGRATRCALLRRQKRGTQDVDDEPGHHPDAREREAPVPSPELTHGAANEGSQHPAEIDAHVVDVVSDGLARIVVDVELVDLTGKARQEQAVAEGDRG